MEGSLETGDGVCVSFNKHFDPAVVEVTHKPGQSFKARRFLGEESKTNVLDLAAHEVPSCDDHCVNSGRLIIADALQRLPTRRLQRHGTVCYAGIAV